MAIARLERMPVFDVVMLAWVLAALAALTRQTLEERRTVAHRRVAVWLRPDEAGERRSDRAPLERR